MSNVLCQCHTKNIHQGLLWWDKTRPKVKLFFPKAILNPIICEKGMCFRGSWPGEVSQHSQVMVRLKLGSLSCQTFPPPLLCRGLVGVPDVNDITELLLQRGTQLQTKTLLWHTGLIQEEFKKNIWQHCTEIPKKASTSLSSLPNSGSTMQIKHHNSKEMQLFEAP